ncbi:MAG TPA: hypothetical protein VFD03_00470 [Clostridia bacterium]|nr:hypothetical protein [Clostridia bacterium]
MKSEFKLKLKACKKGELKRFFEQYDTEENFIAEDIKACIYVFCRPLDSVDVITAIADNDSVYEIDMFIEYGDKFKYKVDGENCNDVVRSLYTLFYR